VKKPLKKIKSPRRKKARVNKRPLLPDKSAPTINFGKVPRAKLPTRAGEFTVYGFRDPVSGEEAVALVAGTPRPKIPTLVRIHSQCLTGDVFHSDRCDCGDQLQRAMQLVAEAGTGVIVYQQQEGRGIGLINKIHAYELQDQGLDTVAANVELGFEADHREYRLPAEILKYLRAPVIRLLSNNPQKVQGLESEGIRVKERLPLEISPRSSTKEYLKTKKEKLGHLLSKV
jgi:3,4-dihydroxy 2-butanone 4-phosphate synthase/GTP cyclohydrolase II